MFAIAHARGRKASLASRKRPTCRPSRSRDRSTPVSALMWTREPMCASLITATGVSAKNDSVTATHAPSRPERIIETRARPWYA